MFFMFLMGIIVCFMTEVNKLSEGHQNSYCNKETENFDHEEEEIEVEDSTKGFQTINYGEGKTLKISEESIFLKKINQFNRFEKVLTFCIVGALIFLVWTCQLLYDVTIEGPMIDEQIEVYEAENERIQENLNMIYSLYWDFAYDPWNEEVEIYTDISLDLKLDESFVNEIIHLQLENYFSNENKIRRLQEEKLNLSQKKWKLYFGR